jgi:hypothetical protein
VSQAELPSTVEPASKDLQENVLNSSCFFKDTWLEHCENFSDRFRTCLSDIRLQILVLELVTISAFEENKLTTLFHRRRYLAFAVINNEQYFGKFGSVKLRRRGNELLCICNPRNCIRKHPLVFCLSEWVPCECAPPGHLSYSLVTHQGRSQVPALPELTRHTLLRKCDQSKHHRYPTHRDATGDK